MGENENKWLHNAEFNIRKNEMRIEKLEKKQIEINDIHLSLTKRITSLEGEFKRCMKDITLSLEKDFKRNMKLINILKEFFRKFNYKYYLKKLESELK